MEEDKFKKLKWCGKINEGLRIVEPSERLSESYLNEAKLSLKRAEKNFEDKDLLWTTVVIYYAEYYALYSFLQRIGLKCENHSCSILAVSYLLDKSEINIINNHKDKRIDAQYYMRIGKEAEVEAVLKEAKSFVLMFEDLILNLDEKQIGFYRNKIINMIDN